MSTQYGHYKTNNVRLTAIVITTRLDIGAILIARMRYSKSLKVPIDIWGLETMDSSFLSRKCFMLIQSIAHQDGEDMVIRYVESPREDLRDRIVEHYASMVKAIARRYAGIELHEDLVQVGFMGLLKALDRFDPKAGVRFNTYASHLVAGEIRHYLRDKSHTVRQPSWVQHLRHRMGKALSLLQNRLDRAPSNRELADELGVSENNVEEVLAANCLMKIESLDAALDGSRDGSSGVELLDAADYGPDQLGIEDRLLMEHGMKGLRPLERQVVGLYHFEELNQSEIAKRVGISCNYVGHILRRSISKISKAIGSEEQRDRILRRQSSNITFEVVDQEIGTYTEKYFHNRLEEEVHRASANEGSMALVVVQFEGLDELGRQYGSDSVLSFLTEAGESLRGTVRRLDMVSRLGDWGFGVILPSTGAGVSVVRDRLLKETSTWMSDRLLLCGGVTLKIGSASTPADGRSAAQLLAAAMPKPLAMTLTGSMISASDVTPTEAATTQPGLANAPASAVVSAPDVEVAHAYARVLGAKQRIRGTGKADKHEQADLVRAYLGKVGDWVATMDRSSTGIAPDNSSGPAASTTGSGFALGTA